MTSTDIEVRNKQGLALMQKHRDNLMAVLPQDSREKFYQIAVSMVNSPALQGCTPGSLFMAIWHCAKMNLLPDPNMGHVWVIARKNKGQKEAQCQIGYRGYIELAERSGRISSVEVGHIWTNDGLVYKDGARPVLEIERHWLRGKDSKGDLMATYCVANYVNGPPHITVCPLDEIKEARDRSMAFKNGVGPWTTDADAMALIVPIRKACRTWPRSTEMGMATKLDYQVEHNEDQYTPKELADKMDGDDMDDGLDDFGLRKKDPDAPTKAEQKEE